MAKKNTATFLGPNKGLSTLGEHCYSFSGSITVAQNTETTLSEFQTGKFYIRGGVSIQGNFDSMGSSGLAVNIYLNGTKIVESETSASNDSVAPFDYPLQIIVPPNTEVKITVSKAASGNHAIQSLLTGRTYAV